MYMVQEYKKSDQVVPEELKAQLPRAVKEPSRFLSKFLKQDGDHIDQTLLSIYQQICARFNTEDEAMKRKYERQAKKSQENYAELTKGGLKTEFNKNDFLKTAFLQYMLYAYQNKSVMQAEDTKKEVLFCSF